MACPNNHHPNNHHPPGPLSRRKQLTDAGTMGTSLRQWLSSSRTSNKLSSMSGRKIRGVCSSSLSSSRPGDEATIGADADLVSAKRLLYKVLCARPRLCASCASDGTPVRAYDERRRDAVVGQEGSNGEKDWGGLWLGAAGQRGQKQRSPPPHVIETPPQAECVSTFLRRIPDRTPLIGESSGIHYHHQRQIGPSGYRHGAHPLKGC